MNFEYRRKWTLMDRGWVPDPPVLFGAGEDEPMPKKPKERVQVRPTTGRQDSALRQSKAKAQAQKARKNG